MRTYKVIQRRYIDGEDVDKIDYIEASDVRLTNGGALVLSRRIDGGVVDVAIFAAGSWDSVIIDQEI